MLAHTPVERWHDHTPLYRCLTRRVFIPGRLHAKHANALRIRGHGATASERTRCEESSVGRCATKSFPSDRFDRLLLFVTAVERWSRFLRLFWRPPSPSSSFARRRVWCSPPAWPRRNAKPVSKYVGELPALFFFETFLNDYDRCVLVFPSRILRDVFYWTLSINYYWWRNAWRRTIRTSNEQHCIGPLGSLKNR